MTGRIPPDSVITRLVLEAVAAANRERPEHFATLANHATQEDRNV